MFVDDDTSTDTTEDTTDDTYGDDSTDTSDSEDVLEVEIDGETYTAEETYDMDGDGANDTAVVETGDGGVVAYADTDHDGTADVAVEYDADGNPVAAAEYDDTTGEWTAADVEDLPPATGDGADDADGSSTDSSDTTDTDDTTDTSSGGEDINVDLPGEDVDAGPATYDTDGDGTNDTAVVTDTDGTTYAFTDVDGDGEADQAVIIESDGDVTVAEHTGEDEWETTETGEINAEGEYVPDDSSSSSASSDAVWAER